MNHRPHYTPSGQKCPPDVENVVERALAKDPRQLSNRRDLAEELRDALNVTRPALRAAEQTTSVAERAAIQRTATPGFALKLP
jgi:hypothetical protein